MKKRRPKFSDWRVLAQDSTGTVERHQCSVEFDELVVGEWFHIERMENRGWWMCIGDVHLFAKIGKDGKATVTVTEGREHLK